MSLMDQRRDQIFPVLTQAQLAEARRFAAGEPRDFAPGAILWAAGEHHSAAFIVLAGEVIVSGGKIAEAGATITRHGVGQITGELGQLSGRASLAEGRAGPAGCRALPFDAAHLRALLIGSAELGEIIMRAYILRRTALIAEGGAGSVVIGASASPAVLRIAGFLARNGYPHTVLDPADDTGGQDWVARLGLTAAQLPVVVCPDGTVLLRPDEAQIGACLGITPDLEPGRVYDVAVVGAGPAGLAASVYAASEGLSVIVLDSRAFGGQAGASARIENYLGFPTGITGQALMGRAFSQAQKFGVDIAIPLEVARLECAAQRKEGSFGVHLTRGGTVEARAVVIASGVRYRRLDVEGLERFEGGGVSYWATPIEAKLCAGETVALVGAGNSAGQAVAFLAPRVKHLHLVVRGDGLEESMSRYLIDRIGALPNVTLHRRTEISALRAAEDGSLAGAVFRSRDGGGETEVSLRHVFLFIGADPNTSWLRHCPVTLDDKGFVVTDAAGGHTDLPLETSVPGIFAIGDVRAGSVKRVGAAIGEGARVVAALHAYFSALDAPGHGKEAAD